MYLMRIGPAWLVRYLSRVMVLEPGDLICAGTPEGTGTTSDPRCLPLGAEPQSTKTEESSDLRHYWWAILGLNQ
ncbi:fumarylacetoacetate hydrolase family protein [Spinactinospora alkalitolerans]|uniref:fumarylacetoacetate hydrolase family protein n=1 Tax=Spinactinospora alkalitolerans TaxID=687207 RepID=UPI0015CA3FAB|nr:fumarylacetoacetate hydrolase family protein [Spinactinospora alkalitolerans]